ncbi:ANTAR domain-containing protein [Methylosoma difficile]
MLNVLLIEGDINHPQLEDKLKPLGYDILKSQYNRLFGSLIKESNPDVIVIHIDTLPDKLFADLHALNQSTPLPVILFTEDSSQESISKAIKADVCEYIVGDNLENQPVATIIQVAMARFNQQQALKAALEEARTQLEDRKQIDRAKAILIKTQNFSENEAYHTLRKLAMDRNITLGEMARNVIAMAELLK